jgi:hypothetical protein
METWITAIALSCRGRNSHSLEKALEILAEEFVTTEKNKAYV